MHQTPWHHKSLVRLTTSLAFGALVAILVAAFWRAEVSFVGGWAAAALLYTVWVWLSVRSADANRTRELSQVDDPGRRISRLVVLLATLASLVGVGVLLSSSQEKGNARIVELLVGVAAIVMSWTLVHMLYMLRYAELYYGDGLQGLTFPGDEPPDYQDFAYFSYCLGMTYQVSDNNVENRLIRRTVLHHTLLSYVLGAVVVASMVNLVVQIASQ